MYSGKSLVERVLSEKRREEDNTISFGPRRPSPTAINPQIEQMLQDILDGLDAIGPRLDAIERDLKEVKDSLPRINARIRGKYATSKNSSQEGL